MKLEISSLPFSRQRPADWLALLVLLNFLTLFIYKLQIDQASLRMLFIALITVFINTDSCKFTHPASPLLLLFCKRAIAGNCLIDGDLACSKLVSCQP